MENTIKSIIVKLIFNSIILLTVLLTIILGIFHIEWYLQEFEYSEPFYAVWNYSMFTYPYSSVYGQPVYIILSIFFVQGVFAQFIFYRNFDKSIPYYLSLVLMIIALIGSLIIPILFYEVAGDDMIFFDYWKNISINERILPGFYCGLLSLFLVIVKIFVIKTLDSYYTKEL
ncbi:MAG: hypothetical protein ACFE9X_08790 [Promethearchaeota archaeon]